MEGLKMTTDNMQAYLTACEEKGLSRNTLLTYRAKLIRLYDLLPENKRIEDENARQNHRIENLEDTVLELTSRQIAALTAAVERLTVNVGTIVEEQKKYQQPLLS